MDAYLEKHDTDKNLHRYYALSVQPNLFNGWSLIRTWGRVRSSRRTLIGLYDDLESAMKDFHRKEREKLRRGYRRIESLSLSEYT